MNADAMSPDFAACLPTIERYLDEYVGSLALPAELGGAVRYALLGGGKRLRPLLVWHACAAVGAPGEASLPAATAVELVHAFSLVHDDLPALDNDDLRRGRPTLHVHAGEAMAILAGDAMLALAFQVLVRRAGSPPLGAALVAELADATASMIVGQVHDTFDGPRAAGIEERRRLLYLIHSNKTGAMIRAACRMGARCGLQADRHDHAPSLALDAITRFGQAVGLMFQIADDLLDVEQTAERAGKRTGKDRTAGKVTYPDVLGIHESRREIDRLRAEALAAVSILGPHADPLRALCEHLASRTR